MESLLTYFVAAMLLAFSAMALRYSAYAVVLAVAMFGLEQVLAIEIEVFQSNQSLYNYIVGVLILVSFGVSFVKRNHARLKTIEGRLSNALLFGSAGYYWLSLLWSPYDDDKNNIYVLVYFFIFVVVLPLLVSRYQEMSRAWIALWAAIGVGALGIVTRHAFPEVIAQQGRLTLLVNRNEAAYGNPLALADLFVYLVLISVMIQFLEADAISKKKVVVRLTRVLSVLAFSLGLYLVFLTSRGEMVAVVLCVLLMTLLVYAQNLRRVMLFLCVAVSMAIVAQILFYSSLHDSILEKAPRYSDVFIEKGIETRIDLALNSVGLIDSSLIAMTFGVGARGCEALLGMYPHSSVIQSIAETGVLGALLFVICNVSVLRLGLKSLRYARHRQNHDAVVYVSFFLSMYIYSVVIGNKKGSLAHHDSWMWLALSTYTFDSALAVFRPTDRLRTRSSRASLVRDLPDGGGVQGSGCQSPMSVW